MSVMTKWLMTGAMEDQIQTVVGEIAEYNGIAKPGQKYFMLIEYFDHLGDGNRGRKRPGVSSWTLDEDEFLDLLVKSKQQKDCHIKVMDDRVIVSRWQNGCPKMIVSEYRPIACS